MKKFILPSIFVFGLLFSCNNYDDSSTNNASIVGTWNYSKNQIQYSKDNKIVDEPLDKCEEKNTLEFSSDNKYKATTYMDNNGNCILEDVSNATYTLVGKTLKVVYGDGNEDSFEAEVVKLTKNELVLKADYGEDLDEDGKNEIDILILKR